MAQTKEIRKKIGSVQNTKKITSAMELVASSKMKKTQDAMKRGKPYSVKIVELIDNLSKASSEYKHPFFKTPEVKSDVYIIVGTDKGLCGGLNTNLFKLALNQMAKNQKSGTVWVEQTKSPALFGTMLGLFWDHIGISLG